MPDNLPGQTLIEESYEAQIWASGPDNNHKRYQQKIHIKSTVTDAGNTSFTTTLRAGNVMARKTSDSLDYLYSPSATDGTQGAIGLLEATTPMIRKGDTVASDRFTHMLSAGIIRNVADLPNVDLQALSVLTRIGFTIAQPTPHGAAFLMHPSRIDFKDGTALSGAYTVVAADNGRMLVAITALVNFTLPTLASVGPGFSVLIYNGVDGSSVITAEADTIVYGDAGGALSTTLTFSTANKKMGGQALLLSGYDGGATPALKWYVLSVTGATSA